jgi:prepilin-type N-terminal cleavage/methylation domain-containing protein
VNVNKKAFSLIELLVVVLIIGILAAIALPQYYKAMRRAKAAELISLIKAVAGAQDVYYLTHGTYALNFEHLDMLIPGARISAGANEDYFKIKDFEIAIKNNGADVYGIYTERNRPLLRMNVQTKITFCCSSQSGDIKFCQALGATVSSGTTSETRSCYKMP